MPSEKIIPGKILYGPDLEVIEGNVCVKDDVIVEVSEEKVDSQNIILPCFINAHTHIGDSVYKDPPLGTYDRFLLKHDLDALVKPPNGLKHRILRRTPEPELVIGMKKTVCDMINTGTCGFADFRESGVPGILALKEALNETNIKTRIFGRPTGDQNEIESVIEEVERLLVNSDGLGISGVNDLDSRMIRSIVSTTKLNKKFFAIHCAEKERKGIEETLELSPDLLVHMNRATEADLKRTADMDIPIVVCPRSNFLTGAGMAPVAKMFEAGISVAVGTDNVMLNSVNMFEEMQLLSKVFGLEDKHIFRMCTLNGAKALNFVGCGVIEEGYNSNIMILNGNSNNLSHSSDILSSVVRRARPDDILEVLGPDSSPRPTPTSEGRII